MSVAGRRRPNCQAITVSLQYGQSGSEVQGRIPHHLTSLRGDGRDATISWVRSRGLRDCTPWGTVPATKAKAVVLAVSPEARSLVDALGEVVPRATFQFGLLGSQRLPTLDAVGLKAAWPNLGWHPFLVTTVKAPQAEFTTLRKALICFLGQFYDSGKDVVGTGVSYVITAASSRRDLDHFANDMVLAAAVMGPGQVVQYLDKWARGEPIQTTHIMVLRGLKMEQESLLLSEGVRLARTPNNIADLIRTFGPPATMVSPGMDMATAFGLDGPAWSMLNATALCMNVIHAPVFQTPGTPEGGLPERKFETDLKADAIVDGLALACDSPVAAIYRWRRVDKDLHAFRGTGRFGVGHGSSDPTASANTPHGPAVVTLDNIGEARRVAEKLSRDDEVTPRTRLAIRRWKNSGTTADVADQFIELRIALEALYADGNHEASYKVASRCARHLCEPGDERRKLHDDVKKFYNRASSFAHGSATEGKKTDKTLVEKVMSTCRDGIIEILDKPVASMIFGKMFWRVWRDFVPKGSPGGLSFLVTTLPLGGGKDHDGFLLRRDAGHDTPWTQSG